MRRLGRGFYKKPALKMAKALLGRYLVSEKNGIRASGMIVETEAYTGKDDPGSHASRGMTKRNAPMFGPAGRSYVYFCYGNHYLFNIVTGRQGEPGAVLIRALEPFEGISAMKKRRANSNLFCLCSGPAKLTQALAIKKRDNDRDLTSGGLYLAGNGRKKFAVCRGPRIGIRHGLEKKWRFWIKGNRHVSA